MFGTSDIWLLTVIFRRRVASRRAKAKLRTNKQTAPTVSEMATKEMKFLEGKELKWPKLKHLHI